MRRLAVFLACALFACLSAHAAFEPPATATVQQFNSGSAATYTTPSGAQRLSVLMVGAGGGGGGEGATTGPTGSTGGNTIFNSINAAGGSGGVGTTTTTPGAGGAGGTGGSGSALWRVPGAAGYTASSGATATGLQPWGGPSTCISGYGRGGPGSVSAATTRASGGGGGAGECVALIITNPAATYTYTVGTGGPGGVGTGTSPATGGAGVGGYIIVYEFYL